VAIEQAPSPRAAYLPAIISTGLLVRSVRRCGPHLTRGWAFYEFTSNPNDILIGSSVLAWLMIATNRLTGIQTHTDTQAHRLGYGLTASVANKPEPHSMHTMRLKSNNDRRFLKNKAIAHCTLRQSIDDAIASLQRYRSIYLI